MTGQQQRSRDRGDAIHPGERPRGTGNHNLKLALEYNKHTDAKAVHESPEKLHI